MFFGLSFFWKSFIIKKIKERFDIEKLKEEKIYIIKGSWCNERCITTNIIINALEKLKLGFLIYKKRVKWNNEIHIKNPLKNRLKKGLNPKLVKII